MARSRRGAVGMNENLSRDLCRIISGGVTGESLKKEILSLIRRHLNLSEATLYLQGPREDYVCDAVPPGAGVKKAQDRILFSDPLVGVLKCEKRPLFRSALATKSRDGNQNALRDRMLQRAVEVSVPLLVGEELVGFLNLGPRQDGTASPPDQIEGLSELFSQVALVLQNRMLCEKLRRSQARMRRADRLALLGTLTAGLAHEIRNPLVSIKTYFQLLPERYDDQEFRERFQKVAAGEVDRISRLVEKLLEFSRPSDPEFRTVDLGELLYEVVTLLESRAAELRITLKRSAEGTSGLILCDPEQLKQVLINIAQNGMDAVDPGGEISFRMRYDEQGGPAAFVHIEIEDNGSGMTPEEIEKLFVPFHTTKTSGTGLGLAISRQIIEEHMGSISVESRPGQGSIFYVHLPLNPPMHDRRKERSRLDQPDSREMVH